MNRIPRLILFAAVLLALVLTSGCKEEDNPFRRQPVTAEQNTPQWRYYHNYKMFEYESRNMGTALSRGRTAVDASWVRLREYLTSMRDNMPEEMAFEFLELTDSYDRVMTDYLDNHKSPNLTSNKLESLNDRITGKYHYSKVWPDWKP